MVRYSHEEAFWGGQGGLPNRTNAGLRELAKKTGLGLHGSQGLGLE